MAVASGISPNFEGAPSARSWKLTGSTVIMSAFVRTDATAEQNVFGATNGFAGSVVAVRIIPTDNTEAKYTVYAGFPDADRIAVAAVNKNAVLTSGTVSGSVVTVAGAFTVSGSLTVVSSTGGNAVVEVIFQTIT